MLRQFVLVSILLQGCLGVFIHLQQKNFCTFSSRVLVNCPRWPETWCCKTSTGPKRAAYFGAMISGDMGINFCSNSPDLSVPTYHCKTATNTGTGDDDTSGICVKGNRSCSGGAAWFNLPCAANCAKSEIMGNQTTSLDGQSVPTCKGSAFGDELAYPEEGGILVIEGTRVEELLGLLADLPEDGHIRVNKFREIGATYYPRVSDYSPNINEDGTTKQ